MSDGPHRSLPMRRHWKILAERAAKAAFSIDQVCEALPYALKKDFREAPLRIIREILGAGEQNSLFGEDKVAQLDAVRRACRGSAAANCLIDSAIEAVGNGLSGETAFVSTVANALADHTRGALRSTEEHYQRAAGGHSAQFIRERLTGARRQCDFKSLAVELTGSGKSLRKSSHLPRHTGIDEGPPL